MQTLEEKGKEGQRLQQYLNSLQSVMTIECIRKSILAPLERYKLLVQTQKSIGIEVNIKQITQQPIDYHWRGNCTNMMAGLMKFNIQYFCYHNVKYSLVNIFDQDNQYVRMASALIASFIISIIVHPLEVIRTKQTTDISTSRRYKGILRSREEMIMSEKGRVMYRGFILSNLTNIPLCVSMMCFLDVLQQKNNNEYIREMVPIWCSQLLAGLTIYPLDTLKRRMMAADSQVWNNTCTSSLKMLQFIYNKEGITSFYAGVTQYFIKSLLTFQLQYILLSTYPFNTLSRH